MPFHTEEEKDIGNRPRRFQPYGRQPLFSFSGLEVGGDTAGDPSIYAFVCFPARYQPCL